MGKTSRADVRPGGEKDGTHVPEPRGIAVRAVKVRDGETGHVRSGVALTPHDWILRTIKVVADREEREDVASVLANEPTGHQAEGGIIGIIGKRPAENLVEDGHLGRALRIMRIRIDEGL